MSEINRNPTYDVVESCSDDMEQLQWVPFRQSQSVVGKQTIGVPTNSIILENVSLSESSRFHYEEIVYRVLRVIPLEITSFQPDEPYIANIPMSIKVVESGNEYIASQYDTNIHASGDTEFEAIENLKSLILDIFEILSREPAKNLGPSPARQIAFLRDHIARK